MPILFCEKTNVFHLFNDHVSYIIRLAAGKYLLHVYWGKRVRAIRDDVLSRLTSYTDETFSLHELPLDVLPQECPTFGTGRPAPRHAPHPACGWYARAGFASRFPSHFDRKAAAFRSAVRTR